MLYYIILYYIILYYIILYYIILYYIILYYIILYYIILYYIVLYYTNYLIHCCRMIVHILKPKMAPNKFNQVMMQFTPVLWSAAICTMVLLTLLLSACQQVTVKYNRQPEYMEYSFRESWIYSIGVVCHQGKYDTLSSLTRNRLK